MIDWTRIEDLRRDIEADSFDDILCSFLYETTAALDDLARGDACATPDAHHFLKGTALALGFAELAAACDRRDPPDRLRDLFAQSRRLFLQGLADRGLGLNGPCRQIRTSVRT